MEGQAFREFTNKVFMHLILPQPLILSTHHISIFNHLTPVLQILDIVSLQE